MSVRRFLAYFLAVTAGSTVAFASFLNAPGASPMEASLQDAAEMSPTPKMVQVLHMIREQQRRKLAAKQPQVALADYHLGN
ncbi:MAG: hypothetical protein M3Y13_08630 [Armatimonadota bacterium]|nr:hypothetical protein [Armatimonadota bacterium]